MYLIQSGEGDDAAVAEPAYRQETRAVGRLRGTHPEQQPSGTAWVKSRN